MPGMTATGAPAPPATAIPSPPPPHSFEDLGVPFNIVCDLALSDDIVESLGPALNARHTLFLYGPPGNGKTAIAEACSRLMGPPLFVPRALWVHGEIVRFYDPVYHAPIQLPNLPHHDTRWVAVHRPAVLVGGELSPDMLELSWDPTLGFYEASAQLKANGGLFLVDDFGRQTKLPPRELLN